MRSITQFSQDRDFTEGTANLIGVMGLPLAHVSSVKDLRGVSMERITERPTSILLHYLTEPPKVNFVSVTSFLQGGIYGIDCNKVGDFPLIFSIHKVDGTAEINYAGKGVPVYDASKLINHSREFLRGHPIRPGSLVFEAHSEIQMNEDARLYALLAIGKPKAPDQCYLLMEDAGVVLTDKGGAKNKRDDEKRESLALSIIGCEEVENVWGDEKTEYEAIYLVGIFQDLPAYCRAQVQMIYCAPPKQAILL